MELKALTYEVDQGVAVITLNRPQRLNAWTGRMQHEYGWALRAADADPDVRVAVVTGAGRGFCAGADLKGLDSMAEAGEYDSGARDGQEPFTHHLPLSLSIPVIAAVNGPAAGVGFVLMCFTDLRFAAAGVKLTTSFARLGLPAEHGVSWVLPRIVGTAAAADLLLSARVVLSDEAAEIGLVNKVLPADELLPFTLDYAQRMAAELSPASLATIKRQLWTDQFRDVTAATTEAVQLMEDMVRQPDFAEGVAAFGEQRPPRFTRRFP